MSNTKQAEATERHRAAWNALTRATSYYQRDRDERAPLRCPPGGSDEEQAAGTPGRRRGSGRQPH